MFGKPLSRDPGRKENGQGRCREPAQEVLISESKSRMNFEVVHGCVIGSGVRQ